MPTKSLLKKLKSNWQLMLLLLILCNNPLVHADNQHTIMVLGDSISAAFGIQREQGWVNLLDQQLKHDYPDTKYPVINASISGETTGGALRRLPQLLTQHKPAVVIIELGGNDGLRGYPITNFRQSLQQLVTLSQQANAAVLLTGMQIPPNYGPRYTQQFYASYAETAQLFNIPLVPFLLTDIALTPGLMQGDGIHPTAAAQPQILQNVLPQLKAILDKLN
ncbi:arylesterase [Oceanicoccus sp. KOV_DT_Chl]|uniref:arylesterase n=1 Tax=Oceanicoccus sp. KOV_DT_Chl TaxID=1904639 RepID=UPI000C7E4426|nr:arylesterase [Oceanicoccus sp. KOV_DT_Chl]